MAVPVKVARQQTTPKPSETGTLRRHKPEPSGTFGTCLRNLHQHTSESSGTFRNLPPELTPPHTGTFQNLPEPASGTYTSTHRNPPEPSGTCPRNLHQHTPEPCGNYTSTPEPSGTYLRNLHQHTPEPSGTFRNVPPEPTPAHTGTLQNLSEPSSGTCSCDPRRNTPELIWAEDPISLRCWGKIIVEDLLHPSNLRSENVIFTKWSAVFDMFVHVSKLQRTMELLASKLLWNIFINFRATCESTALSGSSNNITSAWE